MNLQEFMERGQRAQEAVDQIIDDEHKRQSRVINRDYVKRWALDYASTNRSHPFTRVSDSFLSAIEGATKSAIRDRIMRHPSKGKTLQ